MKESAFVIWVSLISSLMLISGCATFDGTLSSMNPLVNLSGDLGVGIRHASFESDDITSLADDNLTRPSETQGRFDLYCDLSLSSGTYAGLMCFGDSYKTTDSAKPNIKVYRNCRIVGFTKSREQIAKQSARGASSISKADFPTDSWFLAWLILELEDGRLAYIPPQTVKYIEQSEPAKL